MQERLGCAGDGEHVQGNLMKKSGAAALAFEGFLSVTMRSLQGPLQGQLVLLLPALVLRSCRAGRATRDL